MKVDVFVCYGNDHDYDAMSQWLIGVYLTEEEAKEAGETDCLRYVEDEGNKNRHQYDIHPYSLLIPVAPIEGLEVVAYRYRHVDYVNWTYSESKHLRPDIHNEELVTRSQAEAIIAAKDATLQDAIECVKVLTDEKNKLETQLTGRDWMIDEQARIIGERNADNAALTERVKELENSLRHIRAARAALEVKP